MSITEKVVKAAELNKEVEKLEDELTAHFDKVVGKVTHKLLRADHMVIVDRSYFIVDDIQVTMPCHPFYRQEEHHLNDPANYEVWNGHVQPGEVAKTLPPTATEEELLTAVMEVVEAKKKEKNANSA